MQQECKVKQKLLYKINKYRQQKRNMTHTVPNSLVRMSLIIWLISSQTVSNWLRLNFSSMFSLSAFFPQQNSKNKKKHVRKDIKWIHNRNISEKQTEFSYSHEDEKFKTSEYVFSFVISYFHTVVTTVSLIMGSIQKQTHFIWINASSNQQKSWFKKRNRRHSS